MQKELKAKLIVLLVLIGLLGWGVAVWLSNTKEPEPTTTFETSLAALNVVDPSTVKVTINVKNTGTVKDDPTCQISVMNETATYTGSDTFAPGKELKPGETWGFSGLVTVSNEGAAYATKVNAGCYSL